MATAKSTQPRGIRNNNPGNIEYNPNVKWQGLAQEQTDGRFCQFIDPTWGIRAIAVILISYQDKHDIHNVRGIINRWAPPVENNTDAYIKTVADAVGVADWNMNLDLHNYDYLCPIVEAIIRHENGKGPLDTPNTWFDRATVDTALQRAGVVKKVAVVADKVPVTKEVVAATGTAVIGAAQIADAAPAVIQAVESQQDHLTSGSYVRIAIGLATIALAVYTAYVQVKKHQSGVVA